MTTNFCPNCGHPVSAQAAHCPGCGHPLPGGVKPKSKGVTIALWIFLGGLGAHRFYLRDYLWGLAYPLGFIMSAAASMPTATTVLCVVLLIDGVVLLFSNKAYYLSRGAA